MQPEDARILAQDNPISNDYMTTANKQKLDTNLL